MAIREFQKGRYVALRGSRAIIAKKKAEILGLPKLVGDSPPPPALAGSCCPSCNRHFESIVFPAQVSKGPRQYIGVHQVHNCFSSLKATRGQHRSTPGTRAKHEQHLHSVREIQTMFSQSFAPSCKTHDGRPDLPQSCLPNTLANSPQCPIQNRPRAYPCSRSTHAARALLVSDKRWAD